MLFCLNNTENLFAFNKIMFESMNYKPHRKLQIPTDHLIRVRKTYASRKLKKKEKEHARYHIPIDYLLFTYWSLNAMPRSTHSKVLLSEVVIREWKGKAELRKAYYTNMYDRYRLNLNVMRLIL